MSESQMVIFLDIDGVLNDDDERTVHGEYIVGEYVKNLSDLVSLTNAKVILTSSWRSGFVDWINRDFPEEDFYSAHYKMLIQHFSTSGLHFDGITPFCSDANKEDGLFPSKQRPMEIREWLRQHPDTRRFIVLDDEETWDWGDLLPYVILTAKKSEQNLFGSYGAEMFDRVQKGFTRQKFLEALNVISRIQTE